MSRRKSNRIARRLLGMAHWRSNGIKFYDFMVRPAFGWVIARNKNQVRSLKKRAKDREDFLSQRVWNTYKRFRAIEFSSKEIRHG